MQYVFRRTSLGSSRNLANRYVSKVVKDESTSKNRTNNLVLRYSWKIILEEVVFRQKYFHHSRSNLIEVVSNSQLSIYDEKQLQFTVFSKLAKNKVSNVSGSVFYHSKMQAYKDASKYRIYSKFLKLTALNEYTNAILNMNVWGFYRFFQNNVFNACMINVSQSSAFGNSELERATQIAYCIKHFFTKLLISLFGY